MLRRFVIIGLFFANLQGYDPSRLDINTKVFTKLLLLDIEPSKARLEGGVVVLYDAAEERFARMVEENIQRIRPEMTVHLSTYESFKPKPALGYFLLGSSVKETVRSVAKSAVDQGVISYAVYPEYLSLGIMLSLRMEQKVYPELNPEAIKQSAIHFQPILFRIAKQYQP